MLCRKKLLDCLLFNKRLYCSSTTSPSSPESKTTLNVDSTSKLPKDLLRKPSQKLSDLGIGKLEKISLSMKVYLEQARKNADMINTQRSEYELGKRHLANLMGFDFHNMTEKNIKDAVEYLLPSGLFSIGHRPAFLSPEEVYPKIKSADFDTSGRPFHYLAYTNAPLFYEDMHDLYDQYMKCETLKDKMMANGVLVAPNSGKADLAGSRWMTKEEYNLKRQERLENTIWNTFISGLERLANHPYSKDSEEFLMKFRTKMQSKSSTIEITPITFNEDGRPYVQATGVRKNCKAQVTIWGNGNGNIDINGYDILYFPQFKERHQVLFPLLFSEMMNKVDVEAKVQGNGEAAQAGAIRHGIAQALISFVDSTMVEKMRLAGLLTHDRRRKERSKVAKKGARKSSKFRPR